MLALQQKKLYVPNDNFAARTPFDIHHLPREILEEIIHHLEPEHQGVLKLINRSMYRRLTSCGLPRKVETDKIMFFALNGTLFSDREMGKCQTPICRVNQNGRLFSRYNVQLFECALRQIVFTRKVIFKALTISDDVLEALLLTNMSCVTVLHFRNCTFDCSEMLFHRVLRQAPLRKFSCHLCKSLNANFVHDDLFANLEHAEFIKCDLAFDPVRLNQRELTACPKLTDATLNRWANRDPLPQVIQLNNYLTGFTLSTLVNFLMNGYTRNERYVFLMGVLSHRTPISFQFPFVSIVHLQPPRLGIHDVYSVATDPLFRHPFRTAFNIIISCCMQKAAGEFCIHQKEEALKAKEQGTSHVQI